MKVGCVMNFFREGFALPSFFEPAEQMFDELVFVHSPPPGDHEDPSLRLVEERGHRLIHDTLEQGYGALRTRCIGYSECDWVVILDADERMWPSLPALEPRGSDVWPSIPNPQNTTSTTGTILDQRAILRKLVQQADSEDCLALCLSRRHWMGAPGDWSQPCQNWRQVEDWQLRVVKNDPYVCYDPDVKMHERLIDTRTWADPKFLRGSLTEGPFFDHYHLWAKMADVEDQRQKFETYAQLDPSSVGNMWTKVGILDKVPVPPVAPKPKKRASKKK